MKIKKITDDNKFCSLIELIKFSLMSFIADSRNEPSFGITRNNND